MATTAENKVLEKGMPSNVEAEQFVLGSILLDDQLFPQVGGALSVDDFLLEKHKRIFLRMRDLAEKPERIEYLTLVNELERHGQLESVDGIPYIASLTEGLPRLASIDSYVRIVKDKSLLRKLILTSQTIISQCVESAEEVGDILAHAETSIMKVGDEQLRSGLASPKEVIDGYAGGLQAFLDPSRRLKGLSSPFLKLEEMTTGMHGGELIILAARPAMGKTSLALNVAQHIAKEKPDGEAGKTVALFSLEMSKESLLTRILCAEAMVDQHRFRGGYLNEDEKRKLRSALHGIVRSKLFIDDSAGANVLDIAAKCRRLRAEHGLSLIVVDYLQLMGSKGKVENRTQEISQMSRGLKLLAMDLNVPILALSQLSRGPETRQGDHRPLLSDLRESGCLAGSSLVTVACTGARVPIRSLVGRGEFCIWALNENTWKIEPARVSNVFATGSKPVFRLTTRLGRTIRATANHRFRAFHGWKRLDELQVGDSLALPRRLRSPAQGGMPEPAVALLAHLIGDGCTLAGHAIQYTTREAELAEIVRDLAAEVFGDEVQPRIHHERSWFQVYLESSRRHTHGVGSAVADWLRGLGAWNLRSHEKRAPAKLFEQPASSVSLFLRHLWATDGCVKSGANPRAYYATSSEGLARDVQALLLRCGINARLHPVSQAGKGRDQWHVTLSGAADFQAFCTRIGAVGRRRQEEVAKILELVANRPANPNRDSIPSAAWRALVAPAMERQGIPTREMFRRIGTAYCGTRIYRQNISRARAARVAAAVRSEELGRLAASDVYWDPIVSIEPDGVEEVFDITVPGRHNFVADDVVVHNSIEQDADRVMFIFREAVYKPDREDLEGIAELIIAKQRNGPTGKIKLAFLNKFAKFDNLADDLGGGPPMDDGDAPFDE